MANLREDSRGVWSSSGTLEAINAGSLQRIADATEKMAASYDSMRTSRDLYMKWHGEEQKRRTKLERRVAALHGVITKMRKARA